MGKGEKRELHRGTASLEGALACGESLQMKCFMPIPKLTLAASGDMYENERSKSDFVTKETNSFSLSMLAFSLVDQRSTSMFSYAHVLQSECRNKLVQFRIIPGGNSAFKVGRSVLDHRF